MNTLAGHIMEDIQKFRGRLFAATGVMLLSLTVACAPDYVYVQKGKSEADIQTDYIACAEQQQMQFTSAGQEGHRILVLQKTRSTSDCMEDKGYHAMKIEPASHPDRTRAADVSPDFRPRIQ